MRRVALVDLGMGNLRSVERALARAAEDAGAPSAVVRTRDPDAVARADMVVVPGQGAFRDCAAALAAGLGEALRAQIRRGAPYLGICLGLQCLFPSSEEAPGAAGLGVLEGAVVRLAPAVDPGTGERAKIPHMGWSRVELTRDVRGPLACLDGARGEGRRRRPEAPNVDDARGEGGAPHLYFVHSYHAVPGDPALIAAVARHGPHRITAAIEHESITAVQFHPEKSQGAGLRLLARFLIG
ncbi:MAG: imidazole glycerol phosphate synthase subunit HisH [Polyangiaceae bacterium]|nr:imidazole glycerol phosphate synthase subunit HisH [Polyangiaceae bacterium]